MTKLTMLFWSFIVISLIAVSSAARAATVQDLNTDADQALKNLLSTKPLAKHIFNSAKAVLVFPHIVKAGFIFGGAYGEGVMKKGDKIEGYYNSVTASWGLQAGGQSYGYALFLMSDKAVKYLKESNGWEIGVGPTVVMVDEGVAKNLSSSTLKDDAYAFIFNQQGLMAGLSLEGSKISRLEK